MLIIIIIIITAVKEGGHVIAGVGLSVKQKSYKQAPKKWSDGYILAIFLIPEGLLTFNLPKIKSEAPPTVISYHIVKPLHVKPFLNCSFFSGVPVIADQQNRPGTGSLAQPSIPAWSTGHKWGGSGSVSNC